ncbi:hypothetical protein NADFUDRAFT_49960 [Nadsonia fulvescens var. elongata DSM 6958]|uniref:PQ-loop-domain-containing protein n=1 Tax=Nadsonia fulvescens var. elongata DSM 6958 TaxID=857566 RepID=A0A1E3PQ24_9ASCO|nr:hypothetical protein NADFUDRAFT_49960 [Nadsonia fulvescens var. elongata DSM 6958]
MGWAYTACWSASFYPNVVINWKTKSVEGMSLDFLHLNCLGFFSYTASSLGLYASDTVRDQYSRRHPTGIEGRYNYPLVRFNDIVFGAHATLLTVVLLVQLYGSGYRRLPAQKISHSGYSILIGSALALGLAILSVTLFGSTRWGLEWLDVVNLAGSIKVMLTVCKYMPQLWWNFKRKSTRGWSILAIIFDFSGGVLSTSQLVLDGYLQDNISGVFSNVSKVGIALSTLLFDVMFIFQHYVFYADSNDEFKEDEGLEPLL